MPTPTILSLGADLAREQDQVLGDQRIHEIDVLRGKRRSRRRVGSSKRKTALLLIGLLVVVAAASATIAVRFPLVRYSINGTSVTPAESSTLGRWFITSANEPNVIRFTDGSLAEPAKGSRIRVVGTNRRGASFILESGSFELRVAGSSLTEYLVGAGPFALALTRGRVEISWDPMNDSLDLIVNEGRLVISGCQFGTGASVASKLTGVRCSAK